MTTIVAVKGADGVVIGSDTLFTDDHGMKTYLPGGKWHYGRGWAILVTGELPMLCAIKEMPLDKDYYEATQNIDEMTCALRGRIRDSGVSMKVPYDKPGFPVCRANFIITDGRGLWAMDTDLACYAPAEIFLARGSGEHYAVAAIWTLLEAGVGDAAKLVDAALRAAHRFDSSTGEHFEMALIVPEGADAPVAIR
jgi:hypothetical protein